MLAAMTSSRRERHSYMADCRKDWRDVPLLTALSFGVASVEADVSLVNGTLFVSLPRSNCRPVAHVLTSARSDTKLRH